jgi:hypothetical protein
MYRTSSGELTARIEDAVRRLVERDTIRRRLGELDAQLDEHRAAIEEHAPRLAAEERDVERLEAGGLRALLIAGLGEREERLVRERAEAAAARARHDALCAARDQVTAERTDAAARLTTVAGADEEYAAAMAAKEAFLLERGGAVAADLLATAEEIGLSLAWDTQYREAYDAGRNALVAIDLLAQEVRNTVDAGARNMGHDHSAWRDEEARQSLDASRNLAGRVQAWLAAFHRELADVGGHLPDHGEVIGQMLERAAERVDVVSWFHARGDDLTLVLRADRAAEQIELRRQHVVAMLRWLEGHGRNLAARIAQLQAQRADLIRRAE